MRNTTGVYYRELTMHEMHALMALSGTADTLLTMLDACQAPVAGDKARDFEIRDFGVSRPHLQAMIGAAMTRLISPLAALATA